MAMMALSMKFASGVSTATSRYAVTGLFHNFHKALMDNVISMKYFVKQLNLSRDKGYFAACKGCDQQRCKEEQIPAFSKRSFNWFDSAGRVKRDDIPRIVPKSIGIMPFHCYRGPEFESRTGTQSDLLGRHSSCFSFLRMCSVQPCQMRHYSIKKSKSKGKESLKNKAHNLEDQDDSSDEGTDDTEDEDEEDSGDDLGLDDDDVDATKKDWKDLKMTVPSLRIDAILSAGLGISRKKVEDAFLSAKLRHNGNKITKKSKQVVEGDILDVVRDEKVATKDGEQKMVVMRVAVMRVKGERSGSDRIPLWLRRWKRLEVNRKK